MAGRTKRWRADQKGRLTREKKTFSLNIWEKEGFCGNLEITERMEESGEKEGMWLKDKQRSSLHCFWEGKNWPSLFPYFHPPAPHFLHTLFLHCGVLEEDGEGWQRMEEITTFHPVVFFSSPFFLSYLFDGIPLWCCTCECRGWEEEEDGETKRWRGEERGIKSERGAEPPNISMLRVSALSSFFSLHPSLFPSLPLSLFPHWSLQLYHQNTPAWEHNSFPPLCVYVCVWEWLCVCVLSREIKTERLCVCTCA